MNDEPTSRWFEWAAEHLEGRQARELAFRNLFTSEALEAIQNAAQAAYLLGHDCVGAEHLLAGLLKSNHGGVPEFLKVSGIDLPALRSEIDAARGKGCGQKSSAWPQSYTPRFSRVLATVKKEAASRGSSHIDTGHLFLGLLHERDGLPAGILKKFHVDPDQIRLAVLQEMRK